MSERQPQILPLVKIGAIFAVFGFFGGLVSGIFYSVLNVQEAALWEVVLVLVLSPPAHAIIMLFNALIAYPFYLYIARRGWLGLGRVEFRA